jgi:exopolyphosphatase / guanosine-5'-triphosphate,3'-diphosphate pyrophosphatase
MELAVLDLGSTTFHLQHFQVDADGGLTSCLDIKECTSLGAQVFADGHIDATSRAVALQAVDRLLNDSNQRGFTQRVIVATSAIRSAKNGRALAREIEARHDTQVTILEPTEEARLAYLGQAGSAELAGKRFAMVDLGGGSVELSVGRDQQVLFTESLPLGAMRMRVATAAHGCGESQLAALGQLLREQLHAPLSAMQRLAPELIVFGSGSARASRKLLLRDSAQPGKTGPIATESFRRELTALYTHTPAELIGLGVEPARSTTVLTSATIMLQILELLGAQTALVSGRGLRDGVASELWSTLARHSGVFRSTAPRAAAVSGRVRDALG